MVGNFEVVENDKGQWELSHMVSYSLQIYKYLVAKGLVGEEEGIPLESESCWVDSDPPTLKEQTLRLLELKSMELSFQFLPQHRGEREELWSSRSQHLKRRRRLQYPPKRKTRGQLYQNQVLQTPPTKTTYH